MIIEPIKHPLEILREDITKSITLIESKEECEIRGREVRRYLDEISKKLRHIELGYVSRDGFFMDVKTLRLALDALISMADEKDRKNEDVKILHNACHLILTVIIKYEQR